MLANRGRARQRGVWCAHAITLSSLGVHVKLVKSAVEIMALAPCPGAAAAHRFQMAGRKKRPDTPTATNPTPPPHTNLDSMDAGIKQANKNRSFFWRLWRLRPTQATLAVTGEASHVLTADADLCLARVAESAPRCQPGVLSGRFCPALSCLKRTSK